MIVSGMLTTDSWMPKRCSNDTLKGNRYIRNERAWELELVIAIRGHAEELADIRALVFHEAEEPGADCPLNVCIGQP